MSVAARVARLERDLGARAGACCPACIKPFWLRRVDPGATPEQIHAACCCTECGRYVETVKLLAMTPEEFDAL